MKYICSTTNYLLHFFYLNELASDKYSRMDVTLTIMAMQL